MLADSFHQLASVPEVNVADDVPVEQDTRHQSCENLSDPAWSKLAFEDNLARNTETAVNAHSTLPLRELTLTAL